MKQLLIFFTCFTMSARARSQWATDLQILQHSLNNSIEFIVSVRNEFKHNMKVSGSRSFTYIGLAGRPIANYIIELQRWNNGRFSDFSPTADIDPVLKLEDSVLIKRGMAFRDTLRIDPWSFGKSSKNVSAFQPGLYRIRVAFRAFQFDLSRDTFSRWYSFNIR